MRVGLWSVCAALVLAGCGHDAASYSDLAMRDVTLPGGQVIRAEAMTTKVDMLRGMKFRSSLAPDRGMLFIHGQTGLYPYYMYQVEIPLDMIWMDTAHQIVEIDGDVAPCTTAASQCPTYGGTKPARFVLELAGGMARKYGLQVGQTIEF